MTKQQWGEFILNDLANYDRPNDEAIDIRDVWIILDAYTNKMASDGLLLDMRRGDNSIGNAMVVSFPSVPVFLDSSQNLYYTELPCEYLQLPNNRGIDYIGPMMNRTVAYWICDRNAISAFGNHSVAGFGGNVMSWAEQDRIYHYGIDISKVTELYQRFVASGAEAISPNSKYPLPVNYQAAVLEKVRDWFASNRTADRVGDNAENRKQ
jgi:hypothetical protein